MRVEHGFTRTRAGGVAHYLDYGGTGRTAVCLHGVTGNAWAWHDVAERLRGCRRIVSLDLRGHGDSTWSAAGDYGSEQQIDDLEDLVTALGDDPVDLIGSSWGALVALGYTARHAARVASLSIVDIAPSFTQSETDVPLRPQSFADIDDVIDFERTATGSAPQRMLEIMAHFGTRPDEKGFVRKHDPYFFTHWPFRADDRWDELDAVSQPVLLVNAGQTFVAAPTMQQMRDRVDHGQPVTLVRIEESAHVVPVDAPGPLADALATFFGGLDEAG